MRASVAAAIAVVVVSVDGVGAQTSAQAESTLAQASGAREAADARVSRLERELAELDSQIETSFAASAELASEIETARADFRKAMVAAYTSSGTHDALVSYLLEPDAQAASAKRAYLDHRAGDRHDAAERLDALKRGNDPVLIDLVERRETLSAQLTDANDSALQARANEADAERSVAAALEAEATARRDAERAEAAQRAAAASSTTVAPSAAAASPSSRPQAPATTAPPPPPAPSDRESAPLPVLPEGGPSDEQWAALRQCESSGNYQAVSASGRYRGAYQFDVRTWKGLGGDGDPAAAPPFEQDARAKLLYSQRGWRPWPHCGRHLQ